MRLLLTLPLALGLLLAPSRAPGASDEAECAPLPEAAPRVSAALEAPAGPPGASALWVLPKVALEALDEPDAPLAAGVVIEDSYWSPILCASVVRLRGPAGASPGSLLATVPKGSMLVPDDTYFTSAASNEGSVTSAPPGEASVEDAMSGPDPYRPLQFALDELGVDAARAVSSGAGTRIALLDSEPEVGHRDLRRVAIPARSVPPGVAHHGTMVAGILAAEADNRFGIAGVAPEAELLAIPVCVPGSPERGDACALFDVLRGLDAAWEQRAHVINLSLAGPSNPLLQGAADRLDGFGVTLVAAAGNDGTTDPLYPAAYPSVIGVGASGRGGTAYAQGNRGPGLELVAPGADIVSTAKGGGFAFADGTSLATAHVSGVLALLASAAGDLTLARQTLLLEARRHPRADGRVGVLPRVCHLLEQLDRPCPEP